MTQSTDIVRFTMKLTGTADGSTPHAFAQQSVIQSWRRLEGIAEASHVDE